MASIRHHCATDDDYDDDYDYDYDDDNDTICILCSRNFITVSRRSKKKGLICVVCDENQAEH